MNAMPSGTEVFSDRIRHTRLSNLRDERLNPQVVLGIRTWISGKTRILLGRMVFYSSLATYVNDLLVRFPQACNRATKYCPVTWAGWSLRNEIRETSEAFLFLWTSISASIGAPVEVLIGTT